MPRHEADWERLAAQVCLRGKRGTGRGESINYFPVDLCLRIGAARVEFQP